MVHEHDHECGCGHHHHDEDTEHLHTNKYQQAFAKFEAAGTTEEVTGRVKTLLGKHGNDNFTPDVLKQIHGFIDLTSLTSIDTKESIWKLVDKVNDFEGTRPDVPNVAAICTYPLFVETVKEALSAQEVKIASVAGGVRTAEEAVRYYTIVKEVLGNDWLNKDLFRIGASSLVEDIEHRLGK